MFREPRANPSRLRLTPGIEAPRRTTASLQIDLGRLPAWLPTLLLLAAALLPRTTGLADFYTTDEAYFWEARVGRFAAALSQADWAATNQTGHPGVTTMWLGALGDYLAGRAGAPEPGPGTGAAHLSMLRLPLAVANALAVALGYLLLRRLLRPHTALLAGLLWALSPFLIAHSRLLHLDGLLTSLCALSLLALLAATAQGRRQAWAGPALLLASGLAGGLALLTKAPALLLPPLVGLILLDAALRRQGRSWAGLRAAAGRAALDVLAWLAVAALTFWAFWPAMWVDPAGAFGAVLEEISGNAAQPHSAGNFFLGRPVDDPGLLFYPAVVRWRGEPTLFAGLGALLALGLLRLTMRRGSPLAAAEAAAGSPDERRTAAALALFALLFAAAITLMAKKFDRYLLPAWPALQILSAIGLAALLDQWRALADQLRPWAERAGRLALAAALALAVAAPLLDYPPYYLAYYNPLLGGGAAAQEVLLTGWGEGMNQVGAWLSRRPDVARGPVLSWLPPTLAPFLPAGVAVYDLDVDTLYGPANYAVVYSSVADRDQRAVAEAFAMQTPPLYTLRVGGITYATVHQLPRPFERSKGAVFSEVHLRGFSHRLDERRLTVTPSWDIQADRPGGVFCFIHLIDARGRVAAQIDALIDDGMFATLQAGQQFGTPLPIALPPDLPNGRYRVALGLYTMPEGARLPLSVGEPLPESVAGPHAIELLTLEVRGRGVELR